MSDLSAALFPPVSSQQSVVTEHKLIRRLAITVALGFLLLFLVLPLVVVFVEAFRRGLGGFLAAFQEADALAAIQLTLTVAAIAVPLNLVFGLMASWAIAKFEFKGKSLLITLIDLPFSVSPVVSGLIYLLLFGAQGLFGPWLMAPWHQDYLCAARHRARHDLRDISLRGAAAYPAHAGAGHGGGGGCPDPGRESAGAHS